MQAAARSLRVVSGSGVRISAARSARAFSTQKSLLTSSPYDVVARMKSAGEHRGYIVYDEATDKFNVSHPIFQEIAEYLKTARDFNKHEGLFFCVAPKSGALFAATVHKTTRGLTQGGVRFWPYDTFEGVLQDGLRLSQGMGRKNALAGLWWGGGKGVIARVPGSNHLDRAYRNTLFQEYGQFTTSLRGIYYTAEDVGVLTEDMSQIFKTTRFVTCIPDTVGGSGNPSIYTGFGVVCAMEGALDFLARGTLAGKSIAVQGAGNVATYMIDKLLERNVASIIASDINPDAVKAAQQRYAGKPVTVRVASKGDNSILFENVDVVAPCALGGILNSETIPKIKAKVVCGAANNQLLDDRVHDRELRDAGITYVPDFVANRMGIVNCANEQYGVVKQDPAIHRHFGRDWENAIFVIVHKILKRAEKDKSTPSVAANLLADEAMKKAHPIWPERGRQIISGLLADQWSKSKWPFA